jgi:hypothetical protein
MSRSQVASLLAPLLPYRLHEPLFGYVVGVASRFSAIGLHLAVLLCTCEVRIRLQGPSPTSYSHGFVLHSMLSGW